MKTAKMNRTKATVTANKYLAYPAYVSARDLATERKGEIGTTADKRFTAKFDSVATAKAFVKAWTDEYNRACDERMNTPARVTSNTFISKHDLDDYATSAPVDVPAPAPKRTRKGKGNGKAVDFTKVQGKTKSERNKSAHALIVNTGVKSGSDEYKALWNEWTSVR